jgi:hypothetical protein
MAIFSLGVEIEFTEIYQFYLDASREMRYLSTSMKSSIPFILQRYGQLATLRQAQGDSASLDSAII